MSRILTYLVLGFLGFGSGVSSRFFEKFVREKKIFALDHKINILLRKKHEMLEKLNEKKGKLR